MSGTIIRDARIITNPSFSFSSPLWFLPKTQRILYCVASWCLYRDVLVKIIDCFLSHCFLLFIFLSFCFSVLLCFWVSLLLSFYFSLLLCFWVSLLLCFCVSVFLFVCLSVFLSFCRFVFVFLSLSVWQKNYLCVRYLFCNVRVLWETVSLVTEQSPFKTISKSSRNCNSTPKHSNGVLGKQTQFITVQCLITIKELRYVVI